MSNIEIVSKDGNLRVCKTVETRLISINTSGDSWSLNTETADRENVAVTLENFIKFIIANNLTEQQSREMIQSYIDGLSAPQGGAFNGVVDDFLCVIFRTDLNDDSGE